MHKIWGLREEHVYLDREGAYLIPSRNNLIGVIQTPKGYFFIGGGIEAGESHMACIRRECLEETGYLPRVETKICSAEMYTTHPTLGYFHPVQTYYSGELHLQLDCPKEKDHTLCWITYDELRGNMFAQMQNWALDQWKRKKEIP